jgi:hypothetical protein
MRVSWFVPGVVGAGRRSNAGDHSSADGESGNGAAQRLDPAAENFFAGPPGMWLGKRHPVRYDTGMYDTTDLERPDHGNET